MNVTLSDVAADIHEHCARHGHHPARDYGYDDGTCARCHRHIEDDPRPSNGDCSWCGWVIPGTGLTWADDVTPDGATFRYCSVECMDAAAERLEQHP